jgi:hypothetical protein
MPTERKSRGWMDPVVARAIPQSLVVPVAEAPALVVA